MSSEAKYATINRVRYQPTPYYRKSENQTSLSVYGIDTEAYRDGVCFMVATSQGDVFHPWEFPRCLFSRKYRGANFVAYNLKYDSGALLQCLDMDSLKLLQSTGEVVHGGYKYTVIANKCLSIRKGKNTVHIYDMLNFYKMSLSKAANMFLGKDKLDMDTKLFTEQYVKDNWQRIAKYCVYDAVLCKELADVLITKFEAFGVYPKKLYSVAYVSFQYFMSRCPWVHVKRYWQSYKEVLDYAMRSYNGGKFEVTQKGTGYFYEYDIVSAYPYEISNLVDIRTARVEKSKSYRKDARYGFINCKVKIPFEVSSPVALKRGYVNYYPIGEFQKVITKAEFDYLVSNGADATIIDAWWIITSYPQYVYRNEIKRLMRFKDDFKRRGLDMDYHTVKIFLNSFYGKFVQLIDKDTHYKAGTSWNPIFGSIITANCRVRISELQQAHDSIIAVHTDSVISTKPLPLPKKGHLGDIAFEIEGDGVILGSGIYQIGGKTKFRGFDTRKPLAELIPKKGKTLNVVKLRPFTWREIAHRSMSFNKINRFEDVDRNLRLNFDTKRIWLEDYKDFSEVFKRNVESVPWMILSTDSP